MVRVYRCGSPLAITALLAVLGATPGDAQGLSLQLHRVQHPGGVPHHETYQRRRLHTSATKDGALEVVPLNLGMGTHYAWVYAGTPPQRASVITDTGSHIMAFPCSGCDGCGDHTDQPFAAKNSSTLTHITCGQQTFFNCQGCHGPDDSKTCDISQAYLEGSSWHATVVEDIVFLGGESSFQDKDMRNMYGTHFAFGCQNSETGLFITQVADGIMGLSNNDNHIVAKLFKEQKIPNKLFSLCFAPEGGSMAIGAPDKSRHKGKIEYASLVGKPTASNDFYRVQLKDVRIAGTSIEAPDASFKFGQYIVDSGTTDSYLPTSMKKHFQEAFLKVSGFEYETSSSSCTGYTDEEIDKLPNIEIVLEAEGGGNLTLSVTPEQYLLKEQSGKYCSSLFLSESSGGVIGANLMMDRDVIFDQGNSRVGFVDADCEFRDLEEEKTNSTMPAPTSKTPAPPASTVAVETSKPPASSSPAPTTVAPSTAPPTSTAPPMSTAPPTSTLTPTPSPSKTPTQTPSPSPTSPAPTPEPSLDATPEPSTTKTPTPTTSVVPETEKPDADPTSAPATTSKAPAPKTPKTPVHSGTHTSSDTNAGSEGADDHPMVLTIVGTVLAVAFLMGIAFSVRRNKKARKDHNWSRVKENEDDDEDDDEDELIGHSGDSKRSKAKHRRSDELGDDNSDNEDDDDDDNNLRQGGRLSDDNDDDDDDDDDDEIFDQDAHGHEDDHKHDTRVLERL